MRLVIQRVTEASVVVDDKCIGKIENGLLVLLGVGQDDTKEIADKMFQKMTKLRIFSDEDGKTNLSVKDINGEILVVSQFTLYADCKKGNRPSFTKAGGPNEANELYEYFKKLVKDEFGKVECGEFGADMKVALVNDGPFTIVLDSEEICK